MSNSSTGTFKSSKQAVAYALSHRRGPQLKQSSIHREQKGGYRDPWDGCAVRACMRLAGIEPDSHEEREIEAWARGQGAKPIELERRLRVQLDRAGLLEREAPLATRSSLVHVEWTCPDSGLPLRTVSEAAE